MDQELLRGKKYKGEEATNHFDDEYPKYEPQPATVTNVLAPVIKRIPPYVQESLLTFRSEVLKYPGCFQYQASLLEKEAKSVTIQKTNQYRLKMANCKQKYFTNISATESKYSPDLAKIEKNCEF